MRYKLSTIVVIAIWAIDMFLFGVIVGLNIPKVSLDEPQETVVEIDIPEVKLEEPPIIQEPEVIPEEVIIEPEPQPEIPYTQEEIELIALITMGEAEGESEEGKRLVISTILNRVDSPHFPNTVRDVIYQHNQFSCVWSDRLTRCYVRDDICQLVREEMVNRSNHDCIFFNAYHYSIYGTPMFQVGNHYFSSL